MTAENRPAPIINKTNRPGQGPSGEREKTIRKIYIFFHKAIQTHERDSLLMTSFGSEETSPLEMKTAIGKTRKFLFFVFE